MSNFSFKTAKARSIVLLAFLLSFFSGCEASRPEEAAAPKAVIVNASVCGVMVPVSGSLAEVPVEGVEISFEFTREIILPDNISADVSFSGGALSASYGKDKSVLVLRPEGKLSHFTKYSISIGAGEHFGVNLLESSRVEFTTAYNPADKFERLPDEELLTLVQRQTFKYFWDYAHPLCGLARERLGSENTVAIGGSGFGIMGIPVAVERGFISREQAVERMRKILGFLGGKAQRFHGAYPHWIDGGSGAVIPFSAKDNGGDLVETAFLIQGLLAVAGYFDRPEEADIRSAIDAIWRDVEWDWYTRGGKSLYWHWSPSQEWAMNMSISGWNEGLIVYVLAASSPTHPVSKDVYEQGWARGGGIRNGRKFYGVTLPLGSDYGGPMFFAHYSFMGLDPRGLKDAYASYWEQNTAHARINFEYCRANPKAHAGYSDVCWGLTASDIPGGYSASSPTNDKGVIAPTAALASYPYVPDESLAAMRTFYYIYGDRMWGEYGFFDAMCLDKAWFAPSYIAIDQGPIVVMIENGRTGLLWDCFMKHPDVLKGLKILGFSR